MSQFSLGLQVALTAMFICMLGMYSEEVTGLSLSFSLSSPALRGLEHFTGSYVIVKFEGAILGG